MSRIAAIERVLDKRAGRGATDKSLISWLDGMKGKSVYWNRVLDGFIDAIKQTPLKGENHV
ncbi:hypothetical protein K9N50_11430 [bacterium]|nr:hypothetical protein [bacterium]